MWSSDFGLAVKELKRKEKKKKVSHRGTVNAPSLYNFTFTLVKALAKTTRLINLYISAFVNKKILHF